MDFYRDVLGLDEVHSTIPHLGFLRCSARHHDIVLSQASTPGLRRVAWQLESEPDLDEAFERLSNCGLLPAWLTDVQCLELHQGRGFRVHVPVLGTVFEYFVSMVELAEPFGHRLAVFERLGHAVIKVRELDLAVNSLLNNFNFRVSDFTAKTAYFLRCFPNALHHSFAVQQSANVGLHHVNFMVSEIDDIGRALNRLKERNVPVVFGPGRHKGSNSVFLYFLDPDGLTLEYSFGMELFPELGSRGPRMLEHAFKTLDSWGGRPDPRFGNLGNLDISDAPA